MDAKVREDAILAGLSVVNSDEWENAMSRGNHTHAHGVLPEQQLCACEQSKMQGDAAFSRGLFEEAYECYNYALSLVPSGVNCWTQMARETIATLMYHRAETCVKISEKQRRHSEEWFKTISRVQTNCCEALRFESRDMPFPGQLKLRILTLKCEAERLLAETQPCQNKRRSSSQNVPEDIPAFSEPSYFDPSLVRSAAGFGVPVFPEQPEIKKKQRKGDFRSSRTHLTFSGASAGSPPSKSTASTRTYLSFSGPAPAQQAFDQDMC
jgi:hypothetical protein